MKKETNFKRRRYFGLNLLLLGLILTITACGNRNVGSEDIQDFEDLSELVNSREFEVENHWADPTSMGRVNLIGNSNFIRFMGDSVDIFLPYFGERHSGGSYGSVGGGGLRYEGVPEQLEIIENENRDIEIRFRGQEQNENMQFYIRLYPNGKASTSVSSSQRDAISYQGEIRELPEMFR